VDVKERVIEGFGHLTYYLARDMSYLDTVYDDFGYNNWWYFIIYYYCLSFVFDLFCIVWIDFWFDNNNNNVRINEFIMI